jgi:hypothetical protein
LSTGTFIIYRLAVSITQPSLFCHRHPSKWVLQRSERPQNIWQITQSDKKSDAAEGLKSDILQQELTAAKRQRTTKAKELAAENKWWPTALESTQTTLTAEFRCQVIEEEPNKLLSEFPNLQPLRLLQTDDRTQSNNSRALVRFFLIIYDYKTSYTLVYRLSFFIT